MSYNIIKIKFISKKSKFDGLLFYNNIIIILYIRRYIDI
jgi:hypothetical protein